MHHPLALKAAINQIRPFMERQISSLLPCFHLLAQVMTMLHK